MKEIFLQGWHWGRIIRALLALVLLIQGGITHDKMLISFGGFLAVMALFNIGCCGMGTCTTTVPTSQNVNNQRETITYEKVDSE